VPCFCVRTVAVAAVTAVVVDRCRCRCLCLRCCRHPLMLPMLPLPPRGLPLLSLHAAVPIHLLFCYFLQINQQTCSRSPLATGSCAFARTTHGTGTAGATIRDFLLAASHTIVLLHLHIQRTARALTELSWETFCVLPRTRWIQCSLCRHYCDADMPP
jgi:hypothetical protein